MGKLFGSMVIGGALLYLAADFVTHDHPELADAQTQLVALLSHGPAAAGSR
ncbi:MAG TPA: hypothetical protein VFK74_00050 [Azospira sp.]|nr:hypothetical protein [Azospira sp.]